MDNQTKIILALLAILAIFAVIFGLKVTGVIKPKEIQTNANVQNSFNNIEQKSEENSVANLERKIKSREINKKTSLSEFFIKIASSIWVVIIIQLLVIVIGIGEAKLYRKIDMPEWTATYKYIVTFLNVIVSLLNVKLKIISIIISIVDLFVLGYYFMATGMSKCWIAAPFTIVLAFFGTWGLIIGLIGVIAYIVAYIVSNIKLGKMLEKGTAFIVGLAVLPIIFRPILGYQSEGI